MIYIDDFIQNLNNEKKSTLESNRNGLNILEQDYKVFLECKDKKTDIDLKQIYAWFIVGILCVWEFYVIWFSYIQICCPYSHKVSDAVFITLLTTATANILALPTIVLNYLFPKSK